MAAEQYANNAITNLSSGVNSTVTTIVVLANTGFPTASTGLTQFRIAVDTELMLVTNMSSTSWTVTRGIEGSTAAAHNAGAGVYQVLTAVGMPLLKPHYPNLNVQLADDGGNLYYSTGTVFADNSGDILYAATTGALVDAAGNLYFSTSNLFLDTAGELYYNAGSVMVDTNGFLYNYAGIGINYENTSTLDLTDYLLYITAGV